MFPGISTQPCAADSGKSRPSANRYVDSVVHACLDLVNFPYGAAQRNVASPGLQFLHHPKRCTIAYEVNDAASLVIVGVCYGGRDYSHLLPEPPAQYGIPRYQTLAAIPAPGLGWSHGHTARRAQAPGMGR